MVKPYEKIIDAGTELLITVMSYYIPLISKGMIGQVLFNWDYLPEDEKYLAIRNVSAPDELYARFLADMASAHALITNSSDNDVIAELNIADEIQFAERFTPKPKFDPSILANLPPEQVKRITHQAEIFTESIVLDLQNATYLTVENNYLVTKEELQKALEIAANDFIEGLEKGKGAFIQSAGLVNDARIDVFEKADEEGVRIVMQFYNPDPVTDLCTELNGTTFEMDDPNYATFTCPLHFQCKSTYLPIRDFEGEVDGLPELEDLSTEAQSQKQF